MKQYYLYVNPHYFIKMFFYPQVLLPDKPLKNITDLKNFALLNKNNDKHPMLRHFSHAVFRGYYTRKGKYGFKLENKSKVLYEFRDFREDLLSCSTKIILQEE